MEGNWRSKSLTTHTRQRSSSATAVPSATVGSASVETGSRPPSCERDAALDSALTDWFKAYVTVRYVAGQGCRPTSRGIRVDVTSS